MNSRRLSNLQEAYLEELYGIVIEYLLDEGYANTLGSAELIMENMGEGWIQSIVEEVSVDTRSREDLKTESQTNSNNNVRPSRTKPSRSKLRRTVEKWKLQDFRRLNK